MSNCVNCGLAIVPPGVTWAGLSCGCFTETGTRLDAELDAIRSRLQALEQNTVPAGSAKQKPREWWGALHTDNSMTCYRSKGEAYDEAGDDDRIIRVREVLDE